MFVGFTGVCAWLRVVASFALRKRHESSAFHLAAVGLSASSLAEGELLVCKGLVLSSNTGSATAFGNPVHEEAIRSCISCGCPGVIGSLLDGFSAQIDCDGNILLQDSACKKDGARQCTRGQSACRWCLQAANRTKALELVRDWAQRVAWVDLTHLSLLEGTANKAEKNQFIQKVKSTFPELTHVKIDAMAYPELVLKCRSIFLRIPTTKMNDSLQGFVGRSVRSMTPTMLTGVDEAAKEKISSYIEALSNGSLLTSEANSIVSCCVLLWNVCHCLSLFWCVS